MNLIIDVGNTTSKIGIYNSSELVYFQKVVNPLTIETVEILLASYPISHSCTTNSGKIDDVIVDLVKENSIYIPINNDTKIPIINAYNSPETLGFDRLASAIGALYHYPEGNIAKIDMGTCITMDYIDKDKRYVGGNISPGLSMRCRSMHEFTAKLPLIDIEIVDGFIGTDTQSAMKIGAIKGAFYEIETFIYLIQDRFNVNSIVLTGGDAPFFEEYTKFKIFAAPNLVLQGLNEIVNYNAS